MSIEWDMFDWVIDKIYVPLLVRVAEWLGIIDGYPPLLSPMALLRIVLLEENGLVQQIKFWLYEECKNHEINHIILTVAPCEISVSVKDKRTCCLNPRPMCKKNSDLNNEALMTVEIPTKLRGVHCCNNMETISYDEFISVLSLFACKGGERVSAN